MCVCIYIYIHIHTYCRGGGQEAQELVPHLPRRARAPGRLHEGHGCQDSSKGGAVEAGCGDFYAVIR